MQVYHSFEGACAVPNRMQHNCTDLHKSDDLHGVDASHDAKLASHMGYSHYSCSENVGRSALENVFFCTHAPNIHETIAAQPRGEGLELNPVQLR